MFGLTLQKQIGFSHPPHPFMQSVWQGQLSEHTFKVRPHSRRQFVSFRSHDERHCMYNCSHCEAQMTDKSKSLVNISSYWPAFSSWLLVLLMTYGQFGSTKNEGFNSPKTRDTIIRIEKNILF